MGALKDFIDNYSHWVIFLYGVLTGTILTWLFDNYAWPRVANWIETLRLIFGG